MIAILIVSWNVRELLRACLGSLQRYPATLHEQRITVVDNASGDGTLEMLRRDFPEVCVVANATNRGFTGGSNDGLRHIAQSATPACVLLLNPDTEVTPGALDALLACAEAHPQAGVIGPQLRYPDGSVQSSRRRFPTFWTALFESTWLQPIAPRAVLDHYYVRDRRDDEACEVDWVVGAAMLVRWEAYRQVGGLDERNFFMYSEELDWCRRIKAAGWQVFYEPRARVVHHEGQSSAQVSAQRMIYFNTSKVRYFAKHHGRVPAGLLRAALLGMFAWQWGLEGAKWLLGHRRALRAERMRAYARVLRSGLR
ncbi:MAG: glycosyltransferase family 2 protein [Candidatus Thermofonsia Clade 3 bacterium]|uniref:Glycosyltransferase family 2 protein n=1 Tax=Candidatus Thermofonsia Clade 3 bacterium TaxID=2364212 RepID=A0A2M8QD40_9CHLR|nr:glycosyltransferase family 2 protein [Candidatus Roseilinea sp. NK_OTU-006]PJF47672.1 MAG: glycosyltransferase family 2 protein [Candidatus Thermofonsia Clade 3 bacterium]